MPSTEKLTRLGIFLATGYLCAGIVVAIFVGLPLWVNFFSSEFYIGALFTIVTMLVAAVIGVVLMRALVARYGLKPIFDMDVLVLMIGVLFLALSMNQAMVVVGLLVTIGAGTLYFIENFSVQMKAAAQGGPKALSLVGWALGPIVAVAALTIFAAHGMLTLRILLAHYIVIAFWVWVQRLSLHEDYAAAPEFLHRLFEQYQHDSALRAEQDLEYKKNRFAKLYAAAQKDNQSAPKSVNAAPAAPQVEPKVEAKTDSKTESKSESATTKAPTSDIGLSVASVMAEPAPKAETKAEDKAQAQAEEKAEAKPEAAEPAPAQAAEQAPAEPVAEAAALAGEPAKAEPAKAEAQEETPAAESQVEEPKADKPQAETNPETKADDTKADETKADETKVEEPQAQPAAAPQKKKGFFWR